MSAAELMDLTHNLFNRGSNALVGMDAPLIGGTLFKRFDTCVKAYTERFPGGSNRWELDLLQLRAYRLRDEHRVDQSVTEPEQLAKAILATPDSPAAQKTVASHENLLLASKLVDDLAKLPAWEKALEQHTSAFPDDAALVELETQHLALVEDLAPGRLVALARKLAASKDAAVAAAAQEKLDELKPRGNTRRRRTE